MVEGFFTGVFFPFTLVNFSFTLVNNIFTVVEGFFTEVFFSFTGVNWAYLGGNLVEDWGKDLFSYDPQTPYRGLQDIFSEIIKLNLLFCKDSCSHS